VRTEEAPGPSLILTGRSLGRGDDRLGELLLANYLRLLCERPQLPGAVCLLNSAVYLATGDHPAAEHLRRLAEAGTEVLSCRTCLEYFDLVQRVVVGRISSMHEIQGIMLACDRTLVL